jgi:DNA-binding NarL/FixJ family response regulator
MRILIIDRQSKTCQSRRTELNTWYQTSLVREAANACEALHLLEKFQPDMILVDVRVPDCNGLEAIHQIKAEYQSFLVIVLSLNPYLKAKSLSAGADAFVIKNDLPEILWEALSARQCARELTAGHRVRIQNEKEAYTVGRTV